MSSPQRNARQCATARALRYGVSVVLVAAALLVSHLDLDFSRGTPFLLFYPVPLLAFLYGGLGPGLLAAVLSGLAVDCMLLRPYYSTAIHYADFIRVALFTGTQAALCLLLHSRTRALRHSEADLNHAQAVARTGSWRLNVRRNELLWSDQAYELFGVAKGTPLSYESFLAAVHPDDREYVDRQWQAAIVGAPYDIEHRIIVDGEVKWVHEKAELELDANGALLGGFGAVQDITDRKLAEEALIKSEKLASMGRLAASLAHEINNPLAGATNAVFLVGKDQTLSPEGRALAGLAEQELRRAAEIGRRTLGFFREPNARKAVLLSEVIEELTALYHPRLKNKEIFIKLSCAEQDACVRGNVGELRQLFSNLIVNSIDAVGQAGTVHLRVRRVAAVDGAPRFRVTIADTGTGIEPQNLKRIFEPFYTTKQDVGTGLGLWITQEIVKKHGGAIRVRSRVGKGTVFCIFLPAAAPTALAASAGR